jgi:hypothetical protein
MVDEEDLIVQVVLEDLGEEIQVLHCREDLEEVQDLETMPLVVEVAAVDTMAAGVELVDMMVEKHQEHLQAVVAEVLM